MRIKPLYHKLRKVDYRNWINAGILISMLIFFTIWSPGIYERLFNSIIQLFKSFLYLMTYNPTAEVPLIANPIRGADIVIPTTIKQLVYDLKSWSISLINKTVFLNYILDVLLTILDFLRYFIYVPYLVLLALLYRLMYFNPSDDESKGGETKARKIYDKLESKYLKPASKWLFGYVEYNHKHRWSINLGIVILLFGTGLLAIIIDVVSWYLVWSATLSLAGTEVVLISIVFDLVILLHRMGPFVNIVLLLVVFRWLRRKDARTILKSMQTANEEFRDSLGISTLLIGPPGTGKTTMMSSMLVDTEKYIREKTLAIMQKYAALFPDYPFKKLEAEIMQAVDLRKIVNRAQAKQMIEKHHDKWLQEWAYKGAESVFVGNKYIHLLEAIAYYIQAYLLYSTRKALAIANYSVNFNYDVRKTDDTKNPDGFFPIYEYDYIDRNHWQIRDRIAKYATIENFDWRRLAKKKNPGDDSYWYLNDGAAEAVTEIANERGNKDYVPGDKDDPNKASARNDGYNLSIKIGRHIATIDGQPLIYYFQDTQRLGSLNTDNWETCEDIVQIIFRDDIKIPMLLSWLDYGLLKWMQKKVDAFHLEDRHVRKKNTLTAYLISKLAKLIYLNRLKMENEFGYEEVSYKRESGRTSSDGGDMSRGIYYFIYKKVRADMFATDCYADLFDSQRLKAKNGFMDAPTFKSHRPTIEELKGQESYSVDQLVYYTETNFSTKPQASAELEFIKPEQKKES